MATRSTLTSLSIQSFEKKFSAKIIEPKSMPSVLTKLFLYFLQKRNCKVNLKIKKNLKFMQWSVILPTVSQKHFLFAFSYTNPLNVVYQRETKTKSLFTQHKYWLVN